MKSSGRNTLFLGTVELFWGMGMSFISPTAILPVILLGLGSNHLEIALLPILSSIGSGLPQLLSPKYFGKYQKMRGVLVILHLITTLPILLVAISIYLFNPYKFVIIIGYALYSLFVGIVFPLWINYLAKVSSKEKRGNSLGIIFFLQTIAGASGVFIASRIYQRFQNIELIFFFSFIFMFCGSFFFIATKEEGFESGTSYRYFPLKTLMKKYRWLLRFFLSRMLSRGAYLIISSFYIVNLVENRYSSNESAMLLGSSALIFQALFSLFYGRCSDRKKDKTAIIFTLSLFSLSTLLIVFFKSFIVYFIVSFSLGIYVASEFVSFNNQMFSLIKPEERHSAIAFYGFLNTIPQVILPLLGGVLMDYFGMSVTALYSFALLISALLLFISIPSNETDNPRL